MLSAVFLTISLLFCFLRIYVHTPLTLKFKPDDGIVIIAAVSTPDCATSLLWPSLQPIACKINGSAAQVEDAQRFLICALDGQEVQQDPSFDGRENTKRADFGQAGCGPGCSIEVASITYLVCSPRHSIATGSVAMNEQKPHGCCDPRQCHQSTDPRSLIVADHGTESHYLAGSKLDSRAGYYSGEKPRVNIKSSWDRAHFVART
ncbi:uncharacterized protein Z518_09624 [Rhinocladiella mackenziei CBS 650.93]|uniref:Uncharacterized protein n=1 Tax=Rhinocladiella mackenziei CBS 650.93 TaxID=1442369 RepID=A0A0D2I471_9EURO|nr:uncharacterized protein Z518_09624 [Rhinocladiella mackenziei CBS 650.93]KIX00559.1 hypothetical protein Z518_09624 [Rhinocladiella mackenziei CBS 650.93]